MKSYLGFGIFCGASAVFVVFTYFVLGWYGGTLTLVAVVVGAVLFGMGVREGLWVLQFLAVIIMLVCWWLVTINIDRLKPNLGQQDAATRTVAQIESHVSRLGTTDQGRFYLSAGEQ